MLLTLVVRTAPGVHVWSGKPSTLLQRSVGAVTDAFSATAFVVAGFVLNPFDRREFPRGTADRAPHSASARSTAIALKSKEPYAFAGLWEKWKDRNGCFVFASSFCHS
jgi:hypothetical protein